MTSAAGIIPSPSYGGIAVTSLPAPAGVTNAYVPPSTFTVSQSLYYYGSNCSMNRFDPQQLNAFESEMIAFAALLAPNGTWNGSVVNNLATAFSQFASTFSGAISLSTSSAYPSANASNSTAATPAFVTAAVSAAVIGGGLTKYNAADYPTDKTVDTGYTTPAYVNAAVNGILTVAASYPASGDITAVTPAYVAAADAATITAAVAAAIAAVPALTHSASYPSTSDSTSASPAYVTAAVNAAVPTIIHSASYPSSSDAGVVTAAYVAAAIAAVVAGEAGLTHASAYPSASDTTGATPAYVTAAVNAGVSTAEAAIPTITHSASYPSASDTTTVTPAYVTAAVNAGISTAEAAIPALTHSASYPSASDATSATPAYVAAAIAAIPASSSTLAGDTDVTISSPANKQTLSYNSATSKWNNINTPFNMGFSITGLMTASEVLATFVFPQSVTLPSGAANSYAKAGTAAAASTTCNINKNGSSVGTIVWAASGTSATITISSSVSFVAGDVLTIVAPVTPDTALANVGITLAGYLV